MNIIQQVNTPHQARRLYDLGFRAEHATFFWSVLHHLPDVSHRELEWFDRLYVQIPDNPSNYKTNLYSGPLRDLTELEKQAVVRDGHALLYPLPAFTTEELGAMLHFGQYEYLPIKRHGKMFYSLASSSRFEINYSVTPLEYDSEAHCRAELLIAWATSQPLRVRLAIKRLQA